MKINRYAVYYLPCSLWRMCVFRNVEVTCQRLLEHNTDTGRKSEWEAQCL